MTVISLPYCWMHLRSIMHLRIKPSSIPDAGLGLWADWAGAPNGVVYKKGDNLGYYEGEHMSQEQLAERYDNGAPYAMHVNANEAIDGALERYYLAAVNHKPRAQCNVEFLNPHQGRIRVRATKNIMNGQELFINYGNDYRFHAFDNHSTKKTRR